MNLDFGDCADCVHEGVCKYHLIDKDMKGLYELDFISACVSYASYCNGNGGASKLVFSPSPMNVLNLTLKTAVLVGEASPLKVMVNKTNKDFEGINVVTIKVKGKVVEADIYHNASLEPCEIRVLDIVTGKQIGRAHV